MVKWFEKKLSKDNLRQHTLKRINTESKIAKFFRTFSVTNWIIIFNIVVYLAILLSLLAGVNEETLMANIGLQANSFFVGKYWTLLSSMFVHVWLPHLFFNMISLFFVGNFLERIIGRKRYFWFYILSGIGAGLLYVTLSYYFGITPLGERIFVNPNTIAVGASGAIFGIAGLLAMLTPRMKVYLIIGPILAIILQAILTATMQKTPLLSVLDFIITLYIFFAIFSMFSLNDTIRKLSIPLSMNFWILPIVAIVPLVIVGLFVDLPIGNTAHIGGLLVGLIYGVYLRKKYKKKIEMLQRIFAHQ